MKKYLGHLGLQSQEETSVTKSLCSIKGEALIYKNSFVATENGVSPIARYSSQLFDIKHGKWKVERGNVEWKEESIVSSYLISHR